MSKKVVKIKNNNVGAVASKKKLLPFLDMRTVGKYLKNDELEILEKDIKFKDFKKLFKNVQAIVNGEDFLNPKVNNAQVAQWINASNYKTIINTYFGANTDVNNAKTMSICVFENQDRNKFPFIFFSQEEDEWHIEDDIDGNTNDALNDLHASQGGRDFYVVMIFKKNILALSQNNQKKLKK